MSDDYRRSTGKSPAHARALELLRQGRLLTDIAAATGVPTATLKRWAREAGIPFAKPTAEQRAASLQHWKASSRGRRAYDMHSTAKRGTNG